jgi:hypothetical protein
VRSTENYWLSKASPGSFGSQGNFERDQNWRFGASCARCLRVPTLIPNVRLSPPAVVA